MRDKLGLNGLNAGTGNTASVETGIWAELDLSCMPQNATGVVYSTAPVAWKAESLPSNVCEELFPLPLGKGLRAPDFAFLQ